MLRTIRLMVAGVTTALVLSVPCQAGVMTQTLEFDLEGLDLNSNTVSSGGPLSFPSATDFQLTYDSVTTFEIKLLQEPGGMREIAFLDATPFGSVDFASIAGASFTTSIIDLPFQANDTIILKTDLGDYYKIGNPSANLDPFGGTFDFELLEPNSAGPNPVPEPTSLALFAIAACCLLAGRHFGRRAFPNVVRTWSSSRFATDCEPGLRPTCPSSLSEFSPAATTTSCH